MKLNHKKLRAALEFITRFLLLAVPFYALLLLGLDFRWLQKIVAWHATGVLNAAGVGAAADGYLIRYGDWVIFEVVDACTSWKETVAFLALVIAVPRVGWKKRLRALLLVPAIYLTNILRLATVFYVAVTNPRWLALVHDVMWKYGVLLFVLLWWGLWFEYIFNPTPNKKIT